ITKTYLGVLAARDKLTLAKTEEASVALHHELASGKYKMGLIPKTDYLDAKRSWNPAKARNAADYLRDTYRDYSADVVVATDNDAFTFLGEYGDGIFGDAPVVFCGVNDFEESMLAGREGRWTGVAEYIDYDSTLAALRSMFPKVDEVRVLVDDSTTGISSRADFLSSIERNRFPLSVTFFAASDFLSALAEAESLPPTTAVILFTYARDPAYSDRPVSDIVSRLTAACRGRCSRSGISTSASASSAAR
ncbi:MAG TPA: hypothetical protein PLI66_00105, partial [Spirochaetales bacterium]|nr:hypothetical protein [Spirochaetales bacterium]